MRPQLRIIALLIAIALGFLFLSSFTGFFTAGGSSWEGKTSVTVAAEQQQITQHIIFSNHKSQNCADGIFIETQDGTPVTFSTFNEVHNIQGFCTETNVRFDNIIYQIGPQPAEPKTPFSIMTGAQATNSITYEIYYGKISAAGEIALPATEQPQPTIEQPSVAKYGIGGRGGGGTNPLGINTSSCTNITSSGAYVLINDINSTGTCININASNVEFDCDDWNVTYGTGGGNNAYGVNVSSSGALTNVTIKNCDLQKNTSAGSGGIGIYVFNISNSLLQNNTILTNGTSYNYGIYLLNSSTSNNITSNHISTNGVSGDGYNDGIYLYNSSSNTITSNSISTNGTGANYGIYLYGELGGPHSNFNGITSNNISANGVGVLMDYSNSSVSNNIISAIGGGIWCSPGFQYSSCDIISNTVSTSGSSGGNVGISAGSNSNINYNTVMTSGAGGYNTGLVVSGSSNSVTANNISTSGSNSIGIYLDATSANIFYNNIASNVTSWSFYSDTLLNYTVTNLDVGATNVSFTGTKIALRKASAPDEDPYGYQNISKYISATNNEAGAWLFLNVSYNDTDLSDANVTDETTLAMAKYSGGWHTNPIAFTNGVYGRDISANYVYANITDFGSTFAPLSDEFAITHCRSINAPGYYTIEHSIDNFTTTCCIEITSSDVVLDGQNYAIGGNDTALSDGICNSGTLGNVTIENVTVKDWGEGIYLTNLQNSSLINNTVTSNVLAGVTLYVASYNNVTGNTVTSNGGGIGIISVGETNNNNTIVNNNASFNGEKGIGVEYDNYTNITNNTANSNGVDGIWLDGSNNSILDSNTANSNSETGIYLISSSNSALTSNNANSNTNYGIRLVTSCEYNNLTNNTFDGNDYNIYLQASSNNNRFTNNTATSAITRDIHLADSSSNTFINQTVASYPTTVSFTSSGSIDIGGVASPPSDPGSYYNISKYIDATNNSADSWLFLNVSYENSDLGSVDEGTLFIAKYSSDLSDWVLDPSAFTDGVNYGVNTDENYVYANITNFGSDFVPLGTITPSCMNITSDGYYSMTQNLTGVQPGRNMCIDIRANDVTFDCAGYGLDHDDTSGTIGILADGRSNVIIENCVITDYGSGIYLGTGATTNSLIENNTVSSNSYGIRLSASGSNNITNNIANSNTYGIYLNTSSNSNNVTNNTANSNTQYGITLSASSYNKLTANKLSSNSQRGISIAGVVSNNNTIYNNTLTNNNVNVYLDLGNAQYNNISTNTISSGTKSIYLYTLGLGTNNIIEYNSISSTTRGIDLYGDGSVVSIHEYIRHNTISGCSDGIHLENIANNVFLNNTILASGVTALASNYNIYFKNSRNNTFINTTIGSGGNYSTTISFTEWANGATNNVTLNEVVSPPSDPGNYTNISKYVAATSGGSGNWLYLNVSYNDTDLGGVDEGLLAMARNNGSWETTTSNFASTYNVNTDANYVYANITSFGSTFAPLGGSGGGPTVSGCMNITDEGYYALNSSIPDSTAECCINITASDVFFDGQGYTIDGDGLTGLKGVCVYNDTTTLTNVTVKNVTVTEWTDKGIYYNAQNGSIEDNTARNNTYQGIYLEHSENNSITNNNVTNNYYGINLKGDASYNNISNNFANNNLYGIMVEGNYNNLINNTANYNYYDGGLADGGNGINPGSWNNLLNNTANNNDYYGIFMQSGCNITNNTASNNHQYGIYVYAGSETVFINNTARNNDIWDFYSSDNSYNNSVTNLDIGSTIISFNSKDIALRKGTSPGGEPLTAIGKYVNATNNSADSMLYLNVSYTDLDISGVNESTLRISKYNGSWFTNPNAFTDGTHDVNLGENYVYANITNFGSTFAPLGNVSGGGNGTNDTGNVNISVEPMLSITFIDNLVDFGTGFVSAGDAYADVDSNDTASGTAGNWTSTSAGVHGWPDNRDIMTLENNGNVKANVNISAGSNATTFIGGTGPDQWYAAEDNESVSCDGIMQTSYTALGTTQTSLCTSLRDNDTTDALNIMFKLRVPSDAPVSAKTNTITLSAVEA